jgi:hypothetical protein
MTSRAGLRTDVGRELVREREELFGLDLEGVARQLDEQHLHRVLREVHGAVA